MLNKIKDGALAIALLLTISTAALLLYNKDKFFKPRYSLDNLPVYTPLTAGQAELGKWGAVIRLTNKKNGFFCSAFVISDDYALTAAHCIDKDGTLSTEEIFIESSTMEDTGTTAIPAAMNLRGDIGAIVGDFKNFKKLRVEVPPLGFLGKKGPFVACGYPYGDQLLCVNFIPSGTEYFSVIGGGFLFPGMSGGPVIDASSGTVAGVNCYVSTGFVGIGNLTGVFASLDIPTKEK